VLQRRIFVFVIGVLGSSAWAQRPSQPIARPPQQRLGGALVRGRFDTAGVASGALPGVYVVIAVDAKAETLQLRDEAGRTGLLHVNEDLFDLDTVKPGDEVEVDFLVPDPGSTKLEAGGLWKVQR
jgi:hypothetical protein